MTAHTVKVIARLTAKQERIEETRVALIALIEPTRAEDGCIVYELMHNNTEPSDFTFVEEWASDDALDAHLKSEHIRTLQSQADELFAASPDIRRYTLLA
ncbi:MAG: putative quinol monooxygenase [Acidobacteriota bacterium]